MFRLENSMREIERMQKRASSDRLTRQETHDIMAKMDDVERQMHIDAGDRDKWMRRR